MNLLVTNTRNAQAYAIIRALKPYADKIVATMEGRNRLAARFSHAANSRLVDKRYYVPSPEKDWRAGKIQKKNSEREEAYVVAVLRICELEKIDIIFPSFDPHVYVFSKNKQRFEKSGVLIPVPDYETVLTPLDKYRTISAAQEVGFPCPQTYLPENQDELKKIALDMGFPLVIKPRFSSGGRGTSVVKNFSELTQRLSLVRRKQGMPILQEYIPGGSHNRSFHVVVDRNGELKSNFSSTKHRGFRVNGGYGTGQESAVPDVYLTEATRLLHKIGWWGCAMVETKLDPRDGVPKLMEINPRFGNGLWVRTELKVNEPLMCVKIARGEDAGAPHEFPAGTVFVDPVEDVLLLGYHLLDLLVFKLRVDILRRRPLDVLNPPMGLRKLFLSYKHTCLSKKKVFNPYFRYFSQDPLVALLWWLQYFQLILRALRRVGR